MSASRVLVSLPAYETHLLPELIKTSLPLFPRRQFCINCRKEQPNVLEKAVLSSRQTFNKTRYNPKRKYFARKNDFDISTINNAGKGFPFITNDLNASFTRLSSSLTTRHLLPLSNVSIQTPSSTEFQVRCFHLNSPSFSPNNDIIVNTAPIVDPFKMMETEMLELMQDLRLELRSEEPTLEYMSQYYFNGKGKTFRPLVALLMARACNIHSGGDQSITWEQKVVARVSEMIHTASLVHDDVIDASDTRRSQASLNVLYGQRQAILTGDYILSQASIAVARTKNPRVISILASILVDLVNGEFMQLGSKENENERFTHYFDKTYKKTASLIANSCKSVAILGNCDDDIAEVSFQYGRNLGLAFQLIDDLLDFTSCDTDMGKPTAADLKQGLATAPVLFAAQEYPELHAMIMRRFSQDGDVEFARNSVEKSNGVEQTRLLATKHSKEAIRNVQTLTDSEARAGLIRLAEILLERKH